VVAFPVEDRFTKLEEGTVELFVKMGVDAKQMTGEIFFWFTYKRGTDAIFLQFDGRQGAGTTKVEVVGMMPTVSPLNGKKEKSTTWLVLGAPRA